MWKLLKEVYFGWFGEFCIVIIMEEEFEEVIIIIFIEFF